MSVTVIIVNRMTYDLTKLCLESLLDAYPTIAVLLIDNGSKNGSTEYIERVSSEFDNVSCCVKPDPPFQHGNGLSLGASLCITPYFVTLDSDTVVNRGGWIEAMLGRFDANPNLFAIGNVITAGKDCVRKGKRDHRFVHPFCAMWDRGKYNELGKFMAAGQPACAICRRAIQAGYDLETLDGLTESYVTHKRGGTRLKIRRRHV